MHIIILILQIIGILLLVLLGIFIALLLCILFIPIRYSIHADYLPDIEESKVSIDILNIKIKASWFLHFMLFQGKWEDGRFPYRLKVLGITVFDSEKEPKEQKNRKNTEDTTSYERERNTKSSSYSNQDTSKRQIEQKNQDNIVSEENKQEGNNKDNFSEKQNITHAEIKKENIIKKRLRECYLFCKRFIQNIAEKIKRIIYNYAILKAKIKKIYYFIQNEDNKRGWKVIKKQLKQIMKHILPKKIKGYVAFGMEDPSSTGKLLGGIGIMYGFIGEKIKIKPNFQEEQLEFIIDAKGRIRIVTLVRYSYILWKSNEIKKLIRNVNQLKEEL